MKGKDTFTSAEIAELRELIAMRQNASGDCQKKIRNRMREIGFYGRDDWGIINCKPADFEELINTGRIKIIDEMPSTNITAESKNGMSSINKQINAEKDSNWIEKINFSKKESLQNVGFSGFVSVKSLLKNISQIPDKRGVYVVLRTNMDEPIFLEKGSGGYFKGKDPNVAIEKLQENRIYNTPVVYIGKAGGDRKKATLRSRILKYLKFGQGKPVGHECGRYIWQLSDAEELLFCWKSLESEEPEVVETELISAFKRKYLGKRPFANLRK